MREWLVSSHMRNNPPIKIRNIETVKKYGSFHIEFHMNSGRMLSWEFTHTEDRDDYYAKMLERMEKGDLK